MNAKGRRKAAEEGKVGLTPGFPQEIAAEDSHLRSDIISEGFHERNLLLIRAKPDRYQVQRGKEQLCLIAEALDGDWPVAELKRRPADI